LKISWHFQKITFLSLLAIAMGWWEAIVVVYIREILQLNAINLNATVMEQVPQQLIWTEQTREVAPIIILICVSLLVEKNWWRRLGVFLWTFAFWDISYYAGLKIKLGWPPSLTTMDCLFLIPVPWIAPVWFPLGVMLLFILLSLFIFYAAKE